MFEWIIVEEVGEDIDDEEDDDEEDDDEVDDGEVDDGNDDADSDDDEEDEEDNEDGVLEEANQSLYPSKGTEGKELFELELELLLVPSSFEHATRSVSGSTRSSPSSYLMFQDILFVIFLSQYP